MTKIARVPGLFFLGLLMFTGCGTRDPESPAPFTLPPGSEREVVYTDKGDAFWMTRTGGFQDSPWHGLRAAKRPYFRDFIIYANGNLLDREKAEVTVTADRLIRYYPHQKITTSWSLLDTSRALAVMIEAQRPAEFQIVPILEGGNALSDLRPIISAPSARMYEIKAYAELPASYPYVKFAFSESFTDGGSVEKLPGRAGGITVGKFHFSTTKNLTAWVQVADTPSAFDLPDTKVVIERLSQRKNRISQRLARTPVQSNNPELDQAIAWAHASLDALVMNQMGVGIYAGLPWFDEFWGRDLFITFPGAVLVSGGFETARQILAEFARYQDQYPASPTYGRIPNRAQPTDIIYNTTDGTPWFIREMWDYYRYTGDTEFLIQMYPVMKRAALGAMKNWVDKDGLLTHDDGDTWMDARGPEGPWSPRGNRAVEIQQLWLTQLEITGRVAGMAGDGAFAKRIGGVKEQAQRAFEALFRDPQTGRLYDHLNADGTPDLQIRPNALLAPPLLQEQAFDWQTFQETAPKLVTPAGILSLAQTDPNFHPFHQAPGLYVKDAAYHNGIIWMWNAGPWMSAALEFGQLKMADTLFNDLTNQLLQRGAVGTMAEVSDAWPQSDGEIRLSGTISQAWSLGEYLRVFYQDILGFRPELNADAQPSITLRPRLISGLTHVAFTGYAFHDSFTVEYTNGDDAFIVSVQRQNDTAIPLTMNALINDMIHQISGEWKSRELVVRFEKAMRQWTVPESFTDQAITATEFQYADSSVAMCTIDTGMDIPVLAGPGHRLLDQDEVIASGDSGTLLLDATDPTGDDAGPRGVFTYPRNQQFQPGIADITRMRIWENEVALTFELAFQNLVDPGWHPEYGYQLTYAAIGLDVRPSGLRQVGKNAGSAFPEAFTANRLLYVSGGIQIVDESGYILAEYIPWDESGAIGNVGEKTVRFCIPRELFPAELTEAKWLVAVGLQDDHGGAGLGDFRAVEALATEWTGGGKKDGTDGNVYDWLMP
ncbi:MAG: hypothetical protein K9N34_02420 [Candidatus Marinimicrobia bacterium]|nr:hypothetical protein [Candidatus Neomarinimicrobiota bacterium]MCF7839745.1 hypothetical protein [Candidatus Neomarinimicrobiota bacterium]